MKACDGVQSSNSLYGRLYNFHIGGFNLKGLCRMLKVFESNGGN